MVKQQRVSAEEFKSRCLALVDEVQDGEVEVIITRQGTPAARLSAVENGGIDSDDGSAFVPWPDLQGTVQWDSEEAIVAPSSMDRA